MRKNISAVALSLTALVVLGFVMIGCGSSSSSNNLTQAQAQEVASVVSTSISQSIAAALGGADAKSRDDLSSALVCMGAAGGLSCSATISSTYSCPSGGTIGLSGSISGTMDTGSGSIQEQITATPTNCVVDSMTINGDPSIAVAGQVNIASGYPVFPITGSETGTVSYGPNPSNTCTFNVNFSVSSTVGACTVSGTACGRTVSGNC